MTMTAKFEITRLEPHESVCLDSDLCCYQGFCQMANQHQPDTKQDPYYTYYRISLTQPATPEQGEAESKPDPGEGWRWLGIGEIVTDGDQWYCDIRHEFRPAGTGVPIGTQLTSNNSPYRRRIPAPTTEGKIVPPTSYEIYGCKEPATREALSAAGWKSGDAADFLDMSDEERKELEARMNDWLAWIASKSVKQEAVDHHAQAQEAVKTLQRYMSQRSRVLEMSKAKAGGEICQLQEEIVELSIQCDELHRANADLKRANAELRKQVKELDTQNTSLEQKIARLNAEYDALGQSHDIYKSACNKAEAERDNLAAEVAILTQTGNELAAKLERIKGELAAAKQPQPQPVEWRDATDQDRGKPCQVRDDDDEEWEDATLVCVTYLTHDEFQNIADIDGKPWGFNFARVRNDITKGNSND